MGPVPNCKPTCYLLVCFLLFYFFFFLPFWIHKLSLSCASHDTYLTCLFLLIQAWSSSHFCRAGGPKEASTHGTEGVNVLKPTQEWPCPGLEQWNKHHLSPWQVALGAVTPYVMTAKPTFTTSRNVHYDAASVPSSPQPQLFVQSSEQDPAL